MVMPAANPSTSPSTQPSTPPSNLPPVTHRGSALAVLELLKPITWFPPMWAFLCGAVSAGQAFTGHGVAVFFGVLLAGPLVCATSQAVNDWYDREVDAINEPQRPIPSGRIPGKWGLYIGLIWTMLSVIVAGALGPVVLAAASIGLLLAWGCRNPQRVRYPGQQNIRGRFALQHRCPRHHGLERFQGH